MVGLNVGGGDGADDLAVVVVDGQSGEGEVREVFEACVEGDDEFVEMERAREEGGGGEELFVRRVGHGFSPLCLRVVFTMCMIAEDARRAEGDCGLRCGKVWREEVFEVEEWGVDGVVAFGAAVSCETCEVVATGFAVRFGDAVDEVSEGFDVFGEGAFAAVGNGGDDTANNRARE